MHAVTLHCFDLHFQTHIAELGPISDGGDLTILQMWEQAGLLPPNKVNKLSYWKSVVIHTGMCSVMLKEKLTS